jgi:hypothetical protein
LLIAVVDRDPFFCSEEGISINVNDEQPRTAASPMVVTEVGISIGINDEQQSKAFLSMVVAMVVTEDDYR